MERFEKIFKQGDLVILNDEVEREESEGIIVQVGTILSVDYGEDGIGLCEICFNRRTQMQWTSQIQHARKQDIL